MTWWEVGLLVPLLAAIGAGIAGSVLPVLPGPPIILAAGIGYAWATGFRYLGPRTVVALGILTAVSIAVDYAAGALGAARVGASRPAVAVAAILGLAGLFIGPLWLILVLPILGVAVVELLAGRSAAHALKAAGGVGAGTLAGTIARLAICIAMAGIITVGLLS